MKRSNKNVVNFLRYSADEETLSHCEYFKKEEYVDIPLIIEMKEVGEDGFIEEISDRPRKVL